MVLPDSVFLDRCLYAVGTSPPALGLTQINNRDG